MSSPLSISIFRESSAQTKSYLPECYANDIIKDQKDIPEIAFIADLIKTETFPGEKEMDIIQRSRKRRQWELLSLPIIEEVPSKSKEHQIFEWEEWLSREREINECQQTRLKIVSDLIFNREKTQNSSKDVKILNCTRQALAERNHQKNLLL